MALSPSPKAVANLLNKSDPIRTVAIARYNVCILCHMIAFFSNGCAKIGKIVRKNYI